MPLSQPEIDKILIDNERFIGIIDERFEELMAAKSEGFKDGIKKLSGEVEVLFNKM